MRRKNGTWFLVIAIALLLSQPQMVLAQGTADLLKQSRSEQPAGASVETLASKQAAQTAMIDGKNTVQTLSNQAPVSAPQASALMEAAALAPAQQVGMSGASSYSFLYFDPKIQGRGYMVSDSSGIYRTDDGGASWYAINDGVVNLVFGSLAVAPTNSDILYAGSRAGIQRSNDGGKTWTYFTNTKDVITLSRHISYRSIAVSDTDPNVVYVGSDVGQVFKTTDGGVTWTKLPDPGLNGTPVSALHLADNGRIFIGTTKGLFLYQNSAWQKITMTTTNIVDIVSLTAGGQETIYVTDGQRIASTTDAGVPTHWNYTTALPGSGYISRLEVHKDTATGKIQLLVGDKVGYNGSIYFSPDGGVTWTKASGFVNDPASPTAVWKSGFVNEAFSLAFDPFTPGNLFVGDNWNIWKSTNSGASWRESITGSANTMGTDLVRDPNTGFYYFSMMDAGLVQLNPTTGALKSIYPNASTPYWLDGHVWRIDILPNKNILITVSPWDAAQTNMVIVIAPNGTQTIAKGLPATYPPTNTVWDRGYARGLAYDPKNPNRVYLGIDGNGAGLYISDDGGYNWTRSTGQPASLRIYNGLAVDPVETSTIYWGTMWEKGTTLENFTLGGIYKSADGGKTWTKAFSASADIAQIVVGKDQTVYAGAADANGAPAIYVSRNKGVTWSLLKTFPGSGVMQAITIDPNNPNRIVASQRKWNDYTGAKIYITTDAGVTWNEVPPTGLPNTAGAASMVFSEDGKSLYVLMTAGSLYKLPLSSSIPDPDPTPNPSASLLQALLLDPVQGQNINSLWGTSFKNAQPTTAYDNQTITNITSAANYNQIAFLNSLKSTTALYKAIQASADLRQKFNTKYRTYLQASGSPSAADRTVLFTQTAVPGYNQTTFINSLTGSPTPDPTPAANLLQALLLDPVQAQNINSLWGTSFKNALPTTDYDNRTITSITSAANYNQTVFLNSLKSTTALYKALQASAVLRQKYNTKYHAYLQANGSPISADRNLLFTQTAVPGYDQTAFINGLG